MVWFEFCLQRNKEKEKETTKIKKLQEKWWKNQNSSPPTDHYVGGP